MGFSSEKMIKEEETKKGEALSAKGYSLKEITTGKDSFLFGEYLKAKKETRLAKKIASGADLKENEIDSLADKAQEFSERMILVNEAKTLLTKESMLGFTVNNLEFQKIVKILGETRALSAIQSKLGEMAFSSRPDEVARFDAIHSSLKNYTKEKEEVKKNDKIIDEFLVKNNISPEEFSKVLKETDPLKQDKALKELASRGIEEKKRHWYSLDKKVGFNAATWQGLIAQQNLHKASMYNLNARKGEVGSSLSALKGSKDFRKIISDQLFGKEEDEAEPVGLMDAKEGAFSKSDEDDFNHNWENRKREEDYYNKTTDEQEAIEDSFKEGAKDYYREKNKDKKGFWHNVFAAVTEAFINNKKLS